MKRTFTLDTTELDEKALAHGYTTSALEFVFNSLLQSAVNGAREGLVKAERELALKEGRSLPQTDDEIIAISQLDTADAREAAHFAEIERQRLEYEKAEEERLAKLAEEEAARKAAEDERIRQAVAAALAERDAQPDLFAGAQS